MPRNLERKVMRRVRIASEQGKDLFAIPHPAGIDPVPQYHLWIRVMQTLVEPELRVALRLPNGPPGEAARHFDHVLLRISAIDAQRMQFHQLAAVVFIQAAFLFLALIRIRRRRGWERRTRTERASESGAIRAALAKDSA